MKKCLLIAIVLLSGCWGPVTPPTPTPEPTPKGAAVVVLYDSSAADDLGIYADPVLDKYAEEHGYQLRIHASDVVDETGKTPIYLKPYVDYSKDKKLPLVMVGMAGKVMKHFEQPTDTQAVIRLLESTQSGEDRSDAIWAGGAWRKLGAVTPLRTGATKRWTVEGANKGEPLIPESKWIDVSLAEYSRWSTDQDGYSSCCPSSGNGTLAIAAARAGLDVPAKWMLSTMDPYSQIANSDSGANLEDFWAVATKRGVCTKDFCPEQGWKARPPYKEGYQLSRAKHRALQATLCNSWESMASALQRRKPVQFGLMVSSDFSPQDGVIGHKARRGGGGHAVMAIGMKKIGDQWYIVMQNSWGLGWGGSKDGKIPKGMCLLHNSWVEFAFGAFACGSIVSPSDDPITTRIGPQTFTDGPLMAMAL